MKTSFPILDHAPQEGVIRDPIRQIAAAVGALLIPAPAYYFAVNKQRLQTIQSELESLEGQLQVVEAKAAAAVAALRILVEPVTPDTRTYTDIVAASGGGRLQ